MFPLIANLRRKFLSLSGGSVRLPSAICLVFCSISIPFWFVILAIFTVPAKADDITHLWDKLRLTKSEQIELVITGKDIRGPFEYGKNCLIGKIIAEKSINL